MAGGMRWTQLMTLAVLSASLALAQHSLPEQVPIDTPFVSSPTPIVDAMLRLAGVGTADVVYDLGCGDGRIVISAASSFGARGVGIDNNPARIQEAQANSRAAGVTDRVSFQLNDLFQADIHNATVVALYLLPDVNLRLRPRLQRDLRPGTRVVSNTFAMGDWKPEREVRVDGVSLYLWRIPEP